MEHRQEHQVWRKAMEVSVQWVVWALSLYNFPWVRASSALRTAILRGTGNYPSHNRCCELSYMEDEHPGPSPLQTYIRFPDVLDHVHHSSKQTVPHS